MASAKEVNRKFAKKRGDLNQTRLDGDMINRALRGIEVHLTQRQMI